ncbi:MAG: squalene synthase HpnC, partial [Pseudomonadota bacterium]
MMAATVQAQTVATTTGTATGTATGTGAGTAERFASGKGHRDENFPVASILLKRDYRAPILAFYRFARAADDVADNVAAPAAERLAVLDDMRAALAGTGGAEPTATALRDVLTARDLDPRHGLDLLTAFSRDCTEDRTADWQALIDYCRVSAMPVGRYVLDVHGEDPDLWPANDALCAALQIVNHMQDCGKDWHALGRVYLPADRMAAHGVSVDDLARPAATPGLRALLTELAHRTDDLLAKSAGFAGRIRDRRLGLEVAIIHRLCVDLNARLKVR